MLFVCLALASALAVLAHILYEYRTGVARQQAAGRLQSIEALKAGEITHWLAERRADVAVAGNDALDVAAAAEYVARHAPRARERTRRWLASFVEDYGFTSAFIVDASGNVLLAGPGDRRPGSTSPALLEAALSDHDRSACDFLLSRGRPVLDFATPLVGRSGARSLGVLVLRVDPERYLYPLVARWPLQSETGESLLVRRNGVRLEYLSTLRYQAGAPLRFYLPISNAQLAASLAVEGKEGVFDTRDYRGIEVLAAVRSVPSSDWFIVTKINRSEIYAGLGQWVLTIVGLVGALVLAVALVIHYLWRSREYKALGRLYEEQVERHRGDERNEFLSKYANDMILLLDGDLTVLEANDRAVAGYGYADDGLVGRSMRDLLAPTSRYSPEELMRELRSEGSLVFESNHRRRDGSDFPVEASVRLNEQDGRTVLQLISRDITERKKAELSLLESEQLHKALFEQSPVGACFVDRDLVMTECNDRYLEILRTSRDTLIGFKMESSVDPALLKLCRDAFRGGESSYEGPYHATLSGADLWVSARAAPLLDTSGEVTGCIIALNDLTDQKRAREQMERSAFFDTLTGLPNRTLYSDRLERAISAVGRTRRKLAVAVVDLDRFEHINDLLGRSGADELLKSIAERLTHAVREDDTVARSGGDEFLVLLPGLKGEEDALVAAQKVLKTLRDEWQVDGHTFHISASIGLSLCPDDGTDPAEIIKNADRAMRRAKKIGGNDCRFYEMSMNSLAAERLALEHDLRVAIEENQLTLHYQPQVDLREGRIVGVEALVRWQHPDRGLIPPLDFIPLAEETGLIVPIGAWVLGTACRQVKEWIDLFGFDLRLAVNLSARQLQPSQATAPVNGKRGSMDSAGEGELDILAVVERALRRSGLPHRLLEAEVTETAAFADPAAARRATAALRDCGVTIALDDFGTGYSSLTQLRELSVSRLKIDRSFVRDIPDDADDLAIVAAVIDLAHATGVGVVAEGVETQEAVDVLVQRGCDEAQGYLFSPPLPPEECRLLIQQGAFAVCQLDGARR